MGKRGTKGFLLGLGTGAVVGGPLGAVVGGILGASVGNKIDRKKEKHYVCRDCGYEWKSKKSFGQPAFCPKMQVC